jgi:MFS family permease
MSAAARPAVGYATTREIVPPPGVRHGIAANWRQFTLLVIVNVFVGAMVGLERAVLPLVAAAEFGVASTSSALSFIGAFGLTKAIANLFTGPLVDRRGRRFALIVGWLVALPVPFVILGARDWWWIVAANALLGVNQGLAWSATVIMKIDLVGSRQRGLAMGLNEFAGYLAIAGAALASGFAASGLGLRAGPAYIGMAIAVVGLVISVWLVRDTTPHVAAESQAVQASRDVVTQPSGALLLRRSLGADPQLFSLSQAGLVNNLNDGLAWGLFPLLFAGAALGVGTIGALVALYPAVWAVAQLATGPLSDRWGRKRPIVAGMVVQGMALMAIARAGSTGAWAAGLVALGVGTALVYPALLAGVSDVAHPSWRGRAIGVYRFWRDMGYVVGAVLAGVLADTFGVSIAIAVVGGLTVASGIVVAARFSEERNTGEIA